MNYTQKNDTVHMFCDMDGVLADFEKHFLEYTGRNIKEIEKPESYKVISSLPIEWWATIPWMPQAKLLWDFLYNNFENLNILSSPSSDKQRKSHKGKMQWLEKEGIVKQITEENCIIAENKHHYVIEGETCILIDDTPKKIDSWKKAGGIGILHTDVNKTLDELKKYLTN